MKLDKTDRAILQAMQRDGRLSNVNLAREVNLSESACLRRVKLLEQEGVVERYAMIVNQSAVGLPGNVFVEISLAQQQQEELDTFEERVLQIPEVMECYLMSREYDYLLRVVVSDAAHYERVHHQNLTRLPGIARVRSSFALRTVTKATELPLQSV